jgi:glycosyltransferase involved in cell wall biosynthesis
MGSGSAKINLLHIITKLELGGAQKTALELVGNLDRNKYHLFLISSREGMLLEEALKIPDLQIYLVPSLKRYISPISDLKALLSIVRFIKKNNIHIVHTHSSKAGIIGRWAARFAGVPVIIHTIHGFGFHDNQNWFTRKLYISLERSAAKFTDILVAVSESDISKGLRNRIGHRGKYRLIRYGIRLDEFLNNHIDIDDKRRRLGIDPASRVVGMVACLKPQKSPLDFIKAASLVKRSVPEAKFLLIGDGALRRKSENLIRRLKLQRDIRLLGWRRDIADIMRALDVFVLTSLWEGTPLVFLEALASGLPIVATRVDGGPEIVKDQINGFLVPPRDHKMLAEKIITLLSQKQLRQKMGQAGWQMMDKSFDVSTMIKRTEEVYLEIKQKINNT